MSKKILITGASSGFVKLITLTLLKSGHTVVASMRGAESKNKTVAEELKEVGAHTVEIDVTNDISVNHGVENAIEMAGGIDVVVNNADVSVIDLQEIFTPEDWQNLFNINVFGVQRVNRAILPHMRDSGIGIDSCIVEPDGYPTSFMDRLMKSSDSTRDSSYGDFTREPMEFFTNFEKAFATNRLTKSKINKM